MAHPTTTTKTAPANGEAGTVRFPRMHVSLYVRDLQNTLAFYTAFFGKLPAKIQPGYTKYELEEPGLIISFIENPAKVQAAFGHLGFQVDSVEELEHRMAAARRAGLEVREEMGTQCCYALQDKYWVTDPDGYQWEVYLFHEDVAFNDPHYATAEAKACCVPLPDGSPGC